MKKIILSLIAILCITAVFSQEIMDINRKIVRQNYKLSSFDIRGFNTHFADADSIELILYSEKDTLKIKEKPYPITTNSFVNLGWNKAFDSTGIYNLMLINDIDDTLFVPKALLVVKDEHTYSIIQPFYHQKIQAGTNADIDIYCNGVNLAAANLIDILITNLKDTINVDSFSILPNGKIRVHTQIPNDAVGYYHTVVYTDFNKYLYGEYSVLIQNSNQTQIAYIKNYKIATQTTNSDTLFIHTNNTNFTKDSVFAWYSWLNWTEFINNITVVNDTFFYFIPNFNFTINAQYSREILNVYTQSDSLMKYPITFGNSVGIENLINKKKTVKAYPNPSSDILNIESKEFINQDIEINIYSINSQIISTNIFKNKSSYQIDISNYPSGIYLIEVISEDFNEIIRFIKE